MENVKIGQLIAELRKQKQMTQRDLASKLYISDKAVSKWERGLSCPDISLLLPLCEILGITITELLNGEINLNKSEDINMKKSIHNALEYGVKTAIGKIKMTQNIWAFVFSFILLLGIIVVSLINLMVTNTFTWSVIPISASIFAWLVFFPSIKFGIKGIIGSFVNISIFIIPFLYILDYAINGLTQSYVPIFSIGISIAPLLIVLFWVAFFLYKRFKEKKLLYSAFLILFLSPVTFLINLFLDITQGQGQIWFSTHSIINALILFVIAIIFFILSYFIYGKNRKNNDFI